MAKIRINAAPAQAPIITSGVVILLEDKLSKLKLPKYLKNQSIRTEMKEKFWLSKTYRKNVRQVYFGIVLVYIWPQKKAAPVLDNISQLDRKSILGMTNVHRSYLFSKSSPIKILYIKMNYPKFFSGSMKDPSLSRNDRYIFKVRNSQNDGAQNKITNRFIKTFHINFIAILVEFKIYL